MIHKLKISDIILFEDQDLVVLNKSAGLLSIPDREGTEISLKKMLEQRYGRIFTVHRLDKETSGVILFAKNETAHRYLSLQFEERKVEKIYFGLLLGSPANEKGTIEAPISEHPSKKGIMVIHRKGKEAVTDYEVLENFGIYAWVKFQLYTGRTHQVRVHASHIGHPLACDILYGDGKPVLLSSFKHRFRLSKNTETEKPLLGRLGLHALRLIFKNESGKTIQCEAPLPKDLTALLNQLRKWKK